MRDIRAPATRSVLTTAPLRARLTNIQGCPIRPMNSSSSQAGHRYCGHRSDRTLATVFWVAPFPNAPSPPPPLLQQMHAMS